MNLYNDRAKEKIATNIAVPQKSARRPNPLRPPLRLARRRCKSALHGQITQVLQVTQRLPECTHLLWCRSVPRHMHRRAHHSIAQRTHPYDVRASCTHLHPLLTCSYTTIHHLPRTRTAMPPCASSHVYVYTRINTPSSHSSCNKPRLYTLLRHGARGSSLTPCGAGVFRATCTDEHTIPLRSAHSHTA